MTAQQTKDLEATILQEVDGDEAWNTVETLATTVRLSGNEDEAKAIAYLQSKLDSYGVKQTLYTPTLFVSWPLKATLRVLGDDGFSVMAKNPSMSVSTAILGFVRPRIYHRISISVGTEQLHHRPNELEPTGAMDGRRSRARSGARAELRQD